MGVTDETLYGFSPHALCRAVEFHPAGPLFESFKLVIESVVFPVGYGRVVKNVIFVRPFI